ncbi:MAG: RNA polymerase sigma factor [Bacteroidia bacterium]|nr:RNA polymerase sigma factor [Bacteroidia bacterium]
MSKPYKALIQACAAQKPQAQRELYQLFAPRLFAVCCRYAASEAEAEDILQESFIKIFQKISSYEESGSLEGWLRRIVVNTAIDHLRRQKQQKNRASEREAVEIPAADDVIADLEAEQLILLIQQLPDGYRMVFNLYAVEGYSHAEIGKQLGITESTSRSQYTRARALLRENLNQIYHQSYVYKDV